MENVWNPWHGCIRYSEGCANCYVYRRDRSIGKDASRIAKTSSFRDPIRRDRHGDPVIPSGSRIWTCMTSDFFLEQADAWRPEAWRMIRDRPDVEFTIVTKRIVRFMECIPPDWGDGYPNVTVSCTMESQKQCELRFPVFRKLPIRHRLIGCEPLLTDIDMSRWLDPRDIGLVWAGGESGPGARPCRYEWFLHLRRQCVAAGIPFRFSQTGANFIKDGRTWHIERRLQHEQAHRAGIDYAGREPEHEPEDGPLTD